MDNRRYDEGCNPLRVAQLSHRGVDVWGADKVYIGEEVPLENFESGVVLYNATITGANTRIGAGSRIGASGPVRIDDCQIGRDCELGAGVYEGSTLLDGSKVRGFAELRPGTLLEEEAEAAHCCAFKNTILTAGVVAGSMINFCDALLTGGTSRSDHSEIGSGAVHFNFDPRGDKWGSLFGDVRGVLLKSSPIFLGGQCGLVAPLHVDFGAVTAAGSIVRRDVGPDCVKFETAQTSIVAGFDRELYPSLRRKCLSTADLIGTLWALDVWYEKVRLAYADERLKPLYESARKQATDHIKERVKRLEKIIAKLPRSLEKAAASQADLKDVRGEHRKLIENQKAIFEILRTAPEPAPAPERLLREYESARGTQSHVKAVQGLTPEATESAAEWLGGIASAYRAELGRILG
jgi:bifunctional UDP-N-acetylglucosamine pyrophosphorylase/glucosamine-1-phosphate N-acetyltransferase